LLMILLLELFCQYRVYFLKLQNQWIYVNFIIPGEFLFFFWLFYRYFINSRQKILPIWGAVIYIAGFTIDRIYLGKLQFIFSSFSYVVGSIIILVLVLIFLFHFMRSNEILQYKTNMMLWVSLGLLIFFLGALPFYGLFNTLVVNYPDVFDAYWIVQMCFDYCMYLFFAFAFIWGKPK